MGDTTKPFVWSLTFENKAMMKKRLRCDFDVTFTRTNVVGDNFLEETLDENSVVVFMLDETTVLYSIIKSDK